jgi:pyruvate, orthophosphate dikinase
MGRWVYRFGRGRVEGTAKMRDLLGGKGANLAEMSNLGLPVPPGFTITTEVCRVFYAEGRTYPEGLAEEVDEALRAVEEEVGARFGDPQRPLLVSVRSGAPVSMPGMMDTVLNLGLNDATVEGLAALADPRFAYDSYRRFIQMYGNVVLGVEHHLFEERLDALKEDRGYELDTEPAAGDWRALIETYKELVAKETGAPFPQDVREQLWGAIGAVFGSWENPRAVTYRRLHGIGGDMGTAVSVPALVFGNMGDTSATGVAFTRDPSTGERRPHGEFLVNAQGEDVVAGIRTPQPLTEAMREAGDTKLPSMEQVMPRAFAELVEVFDRLERHYRDMQDIEFTVQDGRLWILQTRSGKRTAHAALKIAVDMVEEGLITKEEAVARIDPAALDQLLHPTLDPDAEREIIARGLPASPGAVSGKAVFSADEAERRGTAGEDVILVRAETSPDDIHGMHAARGILTSRGGTTSHAAVVARGMGKPCVCGAGDVLVDAAARSFTVRGVTVNEGDVITLDGGTGTVMLGAVPTVHPELAGDFAMLMGWADEIRRLGVLIGDGNFTQNCVRFSTADADILPGVGEHAHGIPKILAIVSEVGDPTIGNTEIPLRLRAVNALMGQVDHFTVLALDLLDDVVMLDHLRFVDRRGVEKHKQVVSSLGCHLGGRAGPGVGGRNVIDNDLSIVFIPPLLGELLVEPLVIPRDEMAPLQDLQHFRLGAGTRGADQWGDSCQRQRSHADSFQQLAPRDGSHVPRCHR